MSASELTVVTWLWKPRGRQRSYGPEHVHALEAAVELHLDMTHRFVCVTDDPTGLQCETIPLWPDLADPLRPGDGWDTCWRRLKVFARGMEDLFGPRLLSLDLDAIITGQLDPLVDRPEPFVGWNATNRTPIHYNGSMWLLTPGAFPQVWEDFDPRVTPNRLKKLGYIGTDHSQWSRVLGPNQPTWTAADGVVSYRYHCQRGLPPGARIVFFHGKEKPWTVREDWVREHYIGRD